VQQREQSVVRQSKPAPSPDAARAPRRLTREVILEATMGLLEGGGADAVTTRKLGDALQVHPTAVYRHFRDKDELLRAAADLVLEPIGEGLEAFRDDPLALAAQMCVQLRQVLLERPAAAAVMAPGPSRKEHEARFTETVLGLLKASGLSDQDAVMGYHAMVEYSVGSATIDATLAGRSSDEREDVHRRWRADYLALSADQFPYSTALAPLMYPSAEDQFRYGLELLVVALRARTAVPAEDPPPKRATRRSAPIRR
jgi:AcrR family transcriptional regulator